MQTIRVKLIENVASLVTVVKDNATIVLPAIAEPNITNAINAFQTKYPGVKNFYYTTDIPSQVKTITLQHTVVTGDDLDSVIVISDRMYDDEKPNVDLINYLDTLVIL